MTKTNAQKQKDYRDRMKAKGFRKLTFWVHHTVVDAVKAAVKRITGG